MSDFVFLVCSERSGSNFITSLMNGHEEICGPPPTHLFRLFGTNMDRYGDLQCEERWRQLIDDVTEAFSNILGSWNCSVDAAELAGASDERTAAALLRYIYEKEARLDDAEHIFVKENHTPTFAPFLMAHFPDCRFMISVRDPRDVALSWKKTPTIPGGIREAVDTWLADQTAALNLYSQLQGTNRCMLIRYEDLLENVESTLSPVLDWMGLGFTSDVLQFHQDDRTQRNAARISAWDNLGTGVLRNNHAKYLEGLNENEIRYIELRCKVLMQVFGYDASGVLTDSSQDTREDDIAKLEVLMESPEYSLDPAEKSIRQKRLRTIQKILNREQQCLQPATRR